MIAGFALHNSYKSFDAEKKALIHYAIKYDVPYKFFAKASEVPRNFVPYGGIDGIIENLKYNNVNIKPDYYPGFLSQYLYRKVGYTDTWPYEQKCFIKSADKEKRISGFIKPSNSGKGKKKSCKLFACSEIVNFVNEGRYYIDNSKIVAAYQYWCSRSYGSFTYNDDFDAQFSAPAIDIQFPHDKGCGAVDFGTLDNGTLALVESQHPFSCGGYGPEDQFEIYCTGIINGGKYLLSLKN